MRAFIFVLAASLVADTQAYIPSVKNTLFGHGHVKRAVTKDNTCGSVSAGKGKNYTCDAKLAGGGPCCSQNGYCGTTTDYCGAGCQSAFGTCATTPDAGVDPNLCGVSNGSKKCSDNKCCSQHGYCGNSTDYCGNGCQSEFGRCSTPSAGDGRCGPAANNAKCSGTQCCSAAGYCGTGTEFCADPDCQYLFGTCDSNTTPAGALTLTDVRNRPGSVTYSDDIYDCVKSDVVALTFDDGPYSYTSQMLDVLKSYGFTGTFFITGNNLGKGPIDTTAPYPAIVKRMIDEGHQVASHTWSHYNLSGIGSDMRKSQMAKNERAISNIIGKYPTYMRPPYSECTQSSGCWQDLYDLGYHRTYFDLDTQDYLNPLPSQVQASKDIVKKYLAVKGIDDYLSIQHDIGQQSVANLSSYYYDLIKAKGWKGVTVGECLNDPKENWYRAPGGKAGSVSPSTSSTSKNSGQTSTGKVTSSSASWSKSTIPASSSKSSTSSTTCTSSTTKLTQTSKSKSTTAATTKRN